MRNYDNDPAPAPHIAKLWLVPHHTGTRISTRLHRSPQTAALSGGEGTERLRGAPKYYDRLSKAHPPIAKTKDIDDEKDRKQCF
jgi:hypothetical protein